MPEPAAPVAAVPEEPTAPSEVSTFAPEPGRSALVNEAGELQSIPNENVGKALSYGYRPATRAEFRDATESPFSAVMAGVEGATRGATFGLADSAEVAGGRFLLGDEGAERVRRGLEQDREDYPTATMAGEIAGSLAPLAIGAPPAEAGLAAEGFLARAGARVAAGAPRLLAEGAAFGAGHQLTEDVLGNHDAVAGKYLAAGLEGGLVNLLLGSALHVAGGAVFDKLATRAPAPATAGETLASRAVGGLKATAEEQAAKSIMPAAGIGASEMSRLGRTIEEQQTRVRQVGRTLLDEGVTTPLAGKAVQAERIAERLEKTGAELGSIRKSFDATAVRPSAENIVRRIEEEVIAPLVTKPFSGAEQTSVMPYVDEIFAKFGKDGAKGIKSFEELHELRTALDDKLKKFWKMPVEARPAGLEEVAKVRGILESEYEAAAEKAAALAGEDTATKYKVTKALYGDLATASGWAKKAAGKEAQHRAISLTDTIAAGAGLATGHGALAAGALVGNKVMRTYGNQAAAFALDKITKLEMLARASQSFDEKLASSVESFYAKGKTAKTAARRHAITPEQRVALRAAMQNPAALTEHVSDALASQGLHDAAPNVAGAAVLATTRAAQWLNAKLPPEPSPIGAQFGPPKPRKLGPRGQEELDRAVNALDTDAILDDLSNRRLSREQVEALKVVNPELYGAMRAKLREYGMANQPELTVQQGVALSIAFDTPVSSYTRGATIRGFQKAFALGAPSADPASAGGTSGQKIGSGPSKTAQSLASPTDRAEAQGDL